MVGMPSLAALSSLDLPGLVPTISAVVFLVTEEVTVAPSERSLSSAASRPMLSRVPVTMYDLPVSGNAVVVSFCTLTPSSFSSARRLRLSSSANQAKIASATTLPMSGMLKS